MNGPRKRSGVVVRCAVCGRPAERVEVRVGFLGEEWTVFCHGRNETVLLTADVLSRPGIRIEMVSAFEEEARWLT